MRWLSNLWWRLIRFGFRLLYNELAFTYDVVSKVVSLGAWRCWQRSSMQYLPQSEAGIVLELAHGTGDLQIDLKNAGYDTIGFDLSPHMGRIAQRKLRKSGRSGVLIRGRAQELPFATSQFTAIVVTFPTNFIFMPETLGEIYRVLQREGVLIIVLSGLFTGGGPLRHVLEWLYRITGQRDKKDTEVTIKSEILSIFETHGYSAEITQETCPRSKAILVIARKIVLPIQE